MKYLKDKLLSISTAVDKEVADFFFKTVFDGRFVSEWAENPDRVAEELGVEISEEALSRIKEIGENIKLHMFE